MGVESETTARGRRVGRNPERPKGVEGRGSSYNHTEAPLHVSPTTEQRNWGLGLGTSAGSGEGGDGLRGDGTGRPAAGSACEDIFADSKYGVHFSWLLP